jgi:hypothetical protein
MAYRAYHHHRLQRRRLADYFLPLFLFIALAVIVILSIQLYHSIVVKNEPLDLYLYTPQGQTKVLVFGGYNWDPAYNEMRVVQGDEIHALPSARSSLRFFQKLWLRLDENTTVNLQKVAPSRSEDGYEFVLKGGSGRAWFDSQAYTDKHIDMNVFTTHLRVQSSGGVFEVEDDTANKGAEVVRTIQGAVQVVVLVNDGGTEREVEAVNVAAGQEFVMEAADYDAYQKYQSPEVLEPIVDTFVQSDWYGWNMKLAE